MKQTLKKILKFFGVFSFIKKFTSSEVNFNQPVEKVFSDIYKTKYWNSKESVSGTGSTLARTKKMREDLQFVIEKYNIKALLDIPCGDFNWMKEVISKESNLKYSGCDIVAELINENEKKYATNNIKFEVKNLISDPIEKFDLIFCRDCLVHFSDADIFNSLKNIKRSNSTYFLVTSFLDVPENYNITTGQWHPIDLRKHPFNLDKPIEIFIEENSEKNRKKALMLYKIEDFLNF